MKIVDERQYPAFGVKGYTSTINRGIAIYPFISPEETDLYQQRAVRVNASEEPTISVFGDRLSIDKTHQLIAALQKAIEIAEGDDHAAR